MAERTNPLAFLQQVRAEAAKIVWPSRRETAISSVMVMVMAVLASILFLISDAIISRVIAFVIGVGTGTSS